MLDGGGVDSDISVGRNPSQTQRRSSGWLRVIDIDAFKRRSACAENKAAEPQQIANHGLLRSLAECIDCEPVRNALTAMTRAPEARQ
jgi:hypothetical protein